MALQMADHLMDQLLLAADELEYTDAATVKWCEIVSYATSLEIRRFQIHQNLQLTRNRK